ncbi:penicillin-binding protein activator [uncultured Kushneria sp.]|uniref:penicillin-binding protein activator n=1 Tax=uncultured Kushneria sp. TaxID=905033 RepID=UPI00261515E9|nr:penicillin-binding protein activator [uncultured Kushneria sp.]
MRTSFTRLAGAAMVALTLAGCAGTSGIVNRFGGQSPNDLLTQAQQQQGSEAAATRLQAAELFQRQGDNQRALDIANSLDRSVLSSDQQLRWALLSSRAALELQDPQTVLAATSLLDSAATLPDNEKNTLLERRGLAQAMNNQPFDAAQTLIALQQQTDDTQLNDTIWRQLNRLDPGQLDQLAGQGSVAADWAELARLQRQQGANIGALTDAISQWQSNNPRHPASRRLPSDLGALDEIRDQEIRKIAVFLPQSGPLESIATAIREGIETRADDVRSQGGQAPELVFYDTTGQDIESLYARATMEGAQAVIGPLSKEQVSQLETRASVALPTLALNYGTHDHNSARNLFQYGLSAEDEARQAAQRGQLDGLHRAGVMVPNNEWGSRVLGAFQKEWQQEGGDLVSVQNYDPSASATSAVKSVLNGGRGRPDMLFLLALPGYARQVPPTLDYYNAANLPIYATSHVYEGSPQPRLDHDLDDVMFVDIPWLIPEAAAGGSDALPFESTRERLIHDDQPSMIKLHAMGVDAFELGRRLPVMNAIGGFELYGATGRLAPGQDGRVVRTLPWAVFRNGQPTLP